MVQQMHYGTNFDVMIFKLFSKTIDLVTRQTKSCMQFALVLSLIYFIGSYSEYTKHVCKVSRICDLAVILESCVLPSLQSLWIAA